MLGAVIGDIAGSPYEYINMYSRLRIRPFAKTIRGKCQFTDDSVLSMAVANALIHSHDAESEALLGDRIAENLIKYWKRYPLKKMWPVNSCYGDRFVRWAQEGDVHKKGRSSGNGGAMRSVPVGWLCSTLEETLRTARIATERTHDTPEAIEGAQMIAAAVFLAGHGSGKSEIKGYAEERGYRILKGEAELNRLREENKKYRRKKIMQLDFGHFIKCDTRRSVKEALFAFLNTSDFEECIRTAIAIGGDSDTVACMAGGIAEAYYGGVPERWRQEAAKVLRSCGCYPEDLDMVMNFRKYANRCVQSSAI